ncbi:MAG: redoxin domain-containing protein [Candidatus Eisenbacteria bacterium]|nr:redoxin domain-containing protein [Candidatus Eisenbacteria bacterium]
MRWMIRTPSNLTAGALAGALLLAVAAPAPAAYGADDAPAVARKAPRIWGAHWFNSKPLMPADLAGRVTIVEFWAFECINCRRTLPAMRALYERYRADSSVVIVGIHTPELPIERDTEAVHRAVDSLGVRYPVVLDPGYVNWRAFDNQYWPALYLIDRHGVIRDVHIGELHEGTDAWKSVLERIETLRREKA